MPVKPPSEFIQCSDISSCFQAIYNFLFSIFIALAFLYFLYGAFKYLLSAGGVYPKEEGKKKMVNSIIAVIVALGIPIFLNMINPEIFQVRLQVPKLDIIPPVYVSLEVVETSEKDLDTENLPREKLEKFLGPTGGGRLGSLPFTCRQIPANCDVKKIFSDRNLSNIRFSNNDNGTEYINPALKNMINELNEKLRAEGIKIIITDGYSVRDHKSRCHTERGTCIDVVVAEKPPNDRSWDRFIEIARSTGFWVLDERQLKGSKYWTGAHLHLEVR